MAAKPEQKKRKPFFLGLFLCASLLIGTGVYFKLYIFPRGTSLDRMFYCECREYCIDGEEYPETHKYLKANNIQLDGTCIPKCIEQKRKSMAAIAEAAKNGVFVSRYFTSSNCKDGELTPRQKYKALVTSADQGDYAAQKKLCVWPYHKMQYCLLAAKQGNQSATYSVGEAYQRGGENITKDDVEAYFWLSLALSYDDEDCGPLRGKRERANKAIAELRQTLTANEIAALEERLKTWKITAPPLDKTCGEKRSD